MRFQFTIRSLLISTALVALLTLVGVWGLQSWIHGALLVYGLVYSLPLLIALRFWRRKRKLKAKVQAKSLPLSGNA